MSIDPKILKRMQGEDAYMQSQTKGSRRVKVERGHNWIVRFLPARMGPDGLWFARIARHWSGKVPIVCPRNTAEDFGGNPDCDCPVCLVADELNDSADDVISNFGYKAKASPQYLTYCVVWEKDGIQQSLSEILNPYEFWHYRSTFEELKGFYLAGGRKCPDSVLDYEKGNDFSVSRSGKGTRLDKQDSSPIFETDDPKYADHIKKLEAAMKTPKVTIPTDDQLQVFAHKLQASADRGGVGDDDDTPRRRGGRGRQDDEESSFRRGGSARRRTEEEDDLPYDSPPSRSAARAPAPARRSAPEQDDDRGAAEEPAPRRRPAPADEDTQSRRRAPAEDEQPRRRAPVEEEQPRRRAPVEEEQPRRRPANAEDDVQPARRRTPEPEPEPEPEETPRRAAPAPARRPAAQEREPEPEDNGQGGEPEETPPAGRRQLEPTARRAASGAPPQGDPEEDDPLPEDDRDTVPPTAKRGVAGAEDDAPPPVARRGSQGADIKDRLSRMPRGS